MDDKVVYERICTVAEKLKEQDAVRQEFLALLEDLAWNPATPAQKAARRYLREVS